METPILQSKINNIENKLDELIELNKIIIKILSSIGNNINNNKNTQ